MLIFSENGPSIGSGGATIIVSVVSSEVGSGGGTMIVSVAPPLLVIGMDWTAT